MKGKRLPELASGAMDSRFEQMYQAQITDFMIEHAPFLDAESLQTLLRTWDVGKSLLWTGLQVKLDFCRRLPWRLAGVAHHDLAVARRIGKECMALFDAQGPEVQALHHSRTLQILGPSMRPALLAFIEGADWDSGGEVNALARAVLPFKFVPIVERYIEGAHSLVHRGVASSHSPPLISLARRLPRLEANLAQRPEILQELLKCFDRTRHVKSIPELLGISSHPCLYMEGCEFKGQATNPSAKRRDHLVRKLNYIIYRADVEGQFHDTKEQQKQHEQAQERKRKQAARILPEATPALPACVGSVIQTAALQHLQTRYGSREERLTLFSVPTASGVMSRETPLESRLSRIRPVTGTGAAIAIDVDVEDDFSAAAGVDDELFFSIVKTNPGAWHIVQTSRAAASKLGKYDLCIARHAVVGGSSLERCPLVCTKAMKSPSGGAPTSILEGLRELPVDVLRSGLLKWASSSSLRYTIEGWSSVCASQHAVADVVTKLVNCKALPGCAALQAFPADDLDDDETDIIVELFEHDFVDVSRTDGPDSDSPELVRLEKKALAHLSYCCELSSPTPALAVRDELPIEDRTAYELMMELENQGWEWSLLPSKDEDREALDYKPTSTEKVWYTSGVSAHQEYLLCLLQAGTLWAKGITRIPHGAAQSVYRNLLAGKNAPRRLALECDVDLGPRSKCSRRRGAGRGSGSGRGRAGGTGVAEALVDADHSDAESETFDLEWHLEQELEAGEGEEGEEFRPAEEEPAAAEEEACAAAPEPFVPSDNFTWGAFRFTRKPAKPPKSRTDTWQVLCPFHRKSKKTGCVKTLDLQSQAAAAEQDVLNCLKKWACEAKDHDSQWSHVFFCEPVLPALLPPADLVFEILERQCIRDGPTPGSVKTDHELYRSAGAAARRGAAAAGRARGRGGKGSTGGTGGRGAASKSGGRGGGRGSRGRGGTSAGSATAGAVESAAADAPAATAAAKAAARSSSSSSSSSSGSSSSTAPAASAAAKAAARSSSGSGSSSSDS